MTCPAHGRDVAQQEAGLAHPFPGDRDSRRGAARAASAAATSGGTGTFEPWKPRNGRNDPSWTSSSSSDLSSGGLMRQSKRISVRHRKFGVRRLYGVLVGPQSCPLAGLVVTALVLEHDVEAVVGVDDGDRGHQRG
jgi:hypothetical protein